MPVSVLAQSFSARLIGAHPARATMGKQASWKKEQQLSKKWVEVNFQEWDTDRDGGIKRSSSSSSEPGSRWDMLQAKVNQTAEKKMKLPDTGVWARNEEDQQLVADAGAARPAAEDDEFIEELDDLDSAKEAWKSLCSSVFPKAASFEPLQYVAVVAGRPVVVPNA